LEGCAVAALVWALGVGIARWGEGRETLAVVAAAAAAGGILGNYLDRLLCRALDSVHGHLSAKRRPPDDIEARRSLTDEDIRAIAIIVLAGLQHQSGPSMAKPIDRRRSAAND